MLQVSLYLCALVCLRAVSLPDCLDLVFGQLWGYTDVSLVESVQLRVLWKLRLRLRDIAAGSAPPLRPGCPELDVSVCFIDERGIAAAAGLTIGVSSCACLLSALMPAQQ